MGSIPTCSIMTQKQKPTFVIGDVHGHFDRLEALLEKAGLISSGVRLDDKSEVIQIGDLGHFGGSSGSPTGDYLCYQAVEEHKWCDIVIWGNHDYAVFGTKFIDYELPGPKTMELFHKLNFAKRMKFCLERHGFILSHAGLGESQTTENFLLSLNDIAYQRGGLSPAGGILWRDDSEPLNPDYNQVYGHTSGEKVRKRVSESDKISYNIDLGNQYNGRLAGIWLPSQEVVEIKL